MAPDAAAVDDDEDEFEEAVDEGLGFEDDEDDDEDEEEEDEDKEDEDVGVVFGEDVLLPDASPDFVGVVIVDEVVEVDSPLADVDEDNEVDDVEDGVVVAAVLTAEDAASR